MVTGIPALGADVVAVSVAVAEAAACASDMRSELRCYGEAGEKS